MVDSIHLVISMLDFHLGRLLCWSRVTAPCRGIFERDDGPSGFEPMTRSLLCAALLLLPCAWAQGERNLLQAAFAAAGADTSLLLSPDMPGLSLLLANRQATVRERASGAAALGRRIPKCSLVARLSREGPFEYCRIRPAPGSPLAPEELKLVWGFPMAYNESMTLDADALEGHPLYLPDGTIPPAHYLNWGTLFYNRERNLAVGTTLRGAAPAASRWGARTGPASATQLHIWTRDRLAGS